jgi:hypothetical protein
MVKDSPHGAVTSGDVTCRYTQEIHPALDLPLDLVARKRSHPGRRQFDPQWIPPHQLADVNDCGVVLRRRIEPDVRSPGALQEQFH